MATVRERANLADVRFHDLRHAYGTYAGQAGANAFLVRDALGHKTLAMTGRYVNRDADPLRQLADRVSSRASRRPSEIKASPRSAARQTGCRLGFAHMPGWLRVRSCRSSFCSSVGNPFRGCRQWRFCCRPTISVGANPSSAPGHLPRQPPCG